MIFVAVVAALMLGFLAGLFTFKVKNRWCPVCGATTITADDHRARVEAQHR
jgi:NADH pyrophosphatase NudC (nudix superfamily)